jgi:SAM-dependent methyltransferase
MREPITSTRSSSASESPAFPLTADTKASALFYALTIFLSAFLLFQVQPLVAREILPWFGGSAAVWTTCMLFFQMVLLAGYAYAHYLTTARHARWIHCGVLLLTLAALPIIPSPIWKPLDGSLPLLRILGLLVLTVGAPYFVLASTSPLLQTWYFRARGRGVPYRFFALSNLGSMLALLTYPVVVEPHIALRRQAWIWSGGYVVFAVLCFALARKSRSVQREAEAEAAPITAGTRTLWLLLSGCASGLLLAVTNHITQNIAAIPFLWILPLALYLLSFILCFDNPRWYVRKLFLGLFAAAIGAMAYGSAGSIVIEKARVLIPIFCAGLFIACMVLHGELARRKPAPQRLTSFYLTIALGGALGGLFVAAFAPIVFPGLIEFPILLVAAPTIVLFALLDGRPREARTTREELAKSQFWSLWVMGVIATGLVAFFVGWKEYKFLTAARLLARNFYGALRVSDDEAAGIRELAHGTIDHGEQFLDPVRRHNPITYYAPATGVGMLMTDLQKRGPVRLGVVGLGAGTMAAWGRPGDTVRFYEINPLVLRIARTQFTYLRDCPAKVDIVLGDARLSLEREPSNQFDVLAVDAFSGDSIPVHLLTREALRTYWRQLQPNGVLAIHVSNKYLDLSAPLALLAREFHQEAHLIESDRNNVTRTFDSDWVLMAPRATARFPWMDTTDSQIDTIPGLRPWSDDFSNLWQILD